MRGLFADHCVPSDVINALRVLGIQVERARDIGLEGAADEVLFGHACRTSQVLLTTDRDFGNIVRFNIPHSPGVVIVELEGLSPIFIKNRIQQLFRNLSLKRLRGTLTLIEPAETRTWPKRS